MHPASTLFPLNWGSHGLLKQGDTSRGFVTGPHKQAFFTLAHITTVNVQLIFCLTCTFYGVWKESRGLGENQRWPCENRPTPHETAAQPPHHDVASLRSSFSSLWNELCNYVKTWWSHDQNNFRVSLHLLVSQVPLVMSILSSSRIQWGWQLLTGNICVCKIAMASICFVLISNKQSEIWDIKYRIQAGKKSLLFVWFWFEMWC